MSSATQQLGLRALRERFAAFVLEQYPYALDKALAAFELATANLDGSARREVEIEHLRRALGQHLGPPLRSDRAEQLPETSPRVSATTRSAEAVADLELACDGFLHRESIVASFDPNERRERLF